MLFFFSPPERLTRISKVSGHANPENKIVNIETRNRFRGSVAAILRRSVSVVTIMCYIEKGRRGG